ncbi:2-oxoglutarate dehydrogenase complex E2 component [Vermiconidia calcicola]|uniref:2-oxoglutarate dehydrogenase complex E2 component n=1 Tax=Vermiconidia calcicola TaxID=1690605 RepID=A0ACC3M9P6_9PEZI|nr:2-oxoglutarate dehydrogenase complex E2 component [Vermiconidia calcicola]
MPAPACRQLDCLAFSIYPPVLSHEFETPIAIVYWYQNAVGHLLQFYTLLSPFSPTLATEEQIVKTPEMAESITEGTLKGWSVAEGDYVEQDQELGSIETDKIDVAINSPTAGTVKKFLANEEDTVEVGQDLLVLEHGGAPGQSEAKGKDETKGSASTSQQSASDTGGRVVDPEPTQETQQPKQAEMESGGAGKSPKQEQGPQQAKQQQPGPTEEQQPPGKKQEEKNESKPTAQETLGHKQENRPSTPKQESKPSQPKQDESSKAQSPYGSREERRVKMNRMRLRISERLKQSQNTAASLTTFNEVDMSALMNLRKQYKDEILKKTGIKFGFMGAFSMASILAMRTVPTVNASIEGPGSGDTIVYKDYVDISVAVATEKGLVTPIVRNAESLDMVGIERSIAELGKKARDNKLTIEDMAGGTFTISNGGVFGSLMGTPIINLPQTAVLGLHAIKDKPVAVDGKVEIRPMMYLALTYDHRLLDGREAVTFLVKIKEYIENPAKMLIPV